MVFSLKRLVKRNNVGVFTIPKDINFCVGEFPDFGSGSELFFGDNLDGVFLCSGDVVSFVDFTPVTLTDKFVDSDVLIGESSTCKFSFFKH